MKVKLALGETDGTLTSVGVEVRGVHLLASRLPFLGTDGRLKAYRAVYALLWMLKQSPDAVVDDADVEKIKSMIHAQEIKNTRPVSEDADVMTVERFIDACACGAFVNDDGSGYFCTDEKTMTDAAAVPSRVYDKKPVDFAEFTHVAWFNK